MTKSTIHVIGGGLAGLTAAITAAEGGADVVLHEAGAQLGGRARSGDGPYGVNLGPHVVYRGGAVTEFLRRRRLDREVATRLPRPFRLRVVDGRGVHRPHVLASAFLAMQSRRSAPVATDFATWATATFGAHVGDQLRHLAGLYTFHHDPGSLSAEFVWTRCRRTMGRPDTVRYIIGGWSTLVDALERRARATGVHLALGEPVDALPDDGPVVVALPHGPASALLDTPLVWPSARTALLDLALTGAEHLASLVLDTSPDLGGCVMAERFTAVDTTLAPAGVELVQAQLGVDERADLDAVVPRIERTCDALGDWRIREVWRRSSIVTGASGAIDPVGNDVRDRPAIECGDGRYLAGDAVAAPGLLSEVSVNSGVRAAHLALQDVRRRQWAPGWPSATLTPSMRASVLTAAIPARRQRLPARPGPPSPWPRSSPAAPCDRAARPRRSPALTATTSSPSPSPGHHADARHDRSSATFGCSSPIDVQPLVAQREQERVMEEIRHRVGVRAPVEDVYQAVATAEGIARWWTTQVHDDGGAIGVSFGGERAATMVLADAEAPTRMVWQCAQGPAEWVGTSLTFDLRSNGEETVLLFTHAGWAEPVEFMHHCSTRWAYFLMSLKHGLEGGEATPWPRDEKTSSWDN